MNSTTKLLTAILLMAITFSVQAQFPGGAPGAGGPGAGKGGFAGGGMGIGRIYGRVVEGKSKKPVEFASVALYFAKNDSLAGGQLTEQNGDFSITSLPAGAYKLKVSYIGYKTTEIKTTVTMATTDQDVGNIALELDATVLGAVTVTAEKPMLELKPDRKVFNVDKDITARGGTGVDVMKNIPGVSVDADGGVTVRNNSPQVYVDGKPTTLTLEQIPADQIDKIEVITNPSAKFEAAATGGIINVVLKKNQKPGYNGIVSANVGTNGLYNAMGLLNFREKKFGLMLSYNINSNTNRSKGFTERANIFEGVERSSFRQDMNNLMQNTFQFARVNFDYYISNRNTISFSQNAVFGKFKTTEDQTFTTSGDSLTDIHGTRNNQQNHGFQNFTSGMNFKHTYPKADKEWTLDLNYNYSQGGGDYLYTTTNYNDTGSILPFNPELQMSDARQHSNMVTGQWDFTTPIGTNMKLETGVRTNYKRTYSDNTVSNFNYPGNGYVRDSVLSSTYIIDDLVNAAYVTFAQTVKGFSYQAGLRFEESYYAGKLVDRDTSFSYQYPQSLSKLYYSIFPSLNLSQKFSDKHELQFNLTRKIRRPNFFQVSPFIFYSDKFNYRIGNPQLQPEFINQAELNYNLVIPKFNWLSSVYGRFTEQPITPYNSVAANDSLVLINTFINAKNSFNYGWENTIKYTGVKNLDIMVNGNVFYQNINGTATQTINGETQNVSINNSGFSYVLKAMASYKFPLGFVFQANGTYESPRVIAQGKTFPLYFFDLSLSKDFGIATINLTVSDVLNSKRFGAHNEAPTYIQDSSRRRDVRYAKLGVTFRFGKMDASFFKSKKTKKDSGNDMNGGGDGIGY